MNPHLQFLQKILHDLENGKMREITSIEFEIAAEIPLTLTYFDNGGNMHDVGVNSEGKFVTFER